MKRLAPALLALAAFAVCAFGFWRAPDAMAAAWLAAYVWALGPALGALTLMLMLDLAGGGWGTALRPALRAMAGAVPLLIALGAPLLLAVPSLYPWLDGAVRPAQQWWLNGWAIGIGLALCAAFWLWLEYRLRSERPMPRAHAGAAALLQLLAVSVLAIDLLMSLQPVFSSSSFALQFGATQALAAMALALLVTPSLPPRHAAPASGVLLMLSLLWTYLQFMAYLTIWTADLPDEIAWILPRTQTSWGIVTAAAGLMLGPLTIVALAVPALRRGRGLRALGAVVLLGSAMFAQVQVGGAAHPHGAVFGPYHAAALIGIAAIRWLALTRRFSPPRFAAPQADAGSAAATPLRLPAVRRATAEPPTDTGNWRAEADWDLPGRPTLYVAAGAALVLGLLLGGLYAYQTRLFGASHADGPRTSAPPPWPRLQLQAPDDRETVLAAQRRRLESYGWVDREQGIAHIPIERAMALQAQENGS